MIANNPHIRARLLADRKPAGSLYVRSSARDALVRTLCGAPVTANDARFDHVVRAGKLTKNAKFVECDACLRVAATEMREKASQMAETVR